MLSREPEVFFGGGAGGGKSNALLMSALMFAEIPNYSAIIFRRSFPELSLPGGLLERAADWLGGTAAKWNGNAHTWTFPSGATLSFGHMEHEKHKFNYKSSEFDYVGFDELTSFTETQYLYLFSRLRRSRESYIPLRMRSASNPGDIGHAFVKKRFVQPTESVAGRRFIPSLLEDNPYLDKEEYTAALMNLDSFTRRQLLKGDWTDFRGNVFFPSGWPRYVDMGDAWSMRDLPIRTIVRYQDVMILIALDIATKEKKTSDYTAFVVAGLTGDGRILILEVVNERIPLERVAYVLDSLCERWRPSVVAGDDDNLSFAMLLEYRRHKHIPEVRMMPIGGRSKIKRATPAVIHGENKRIYLPDSAPWLDDFSDQLVSFTGIQAEHDDMVDCVGIIGRLADQLKMPARTTRLPEVLVGGKVTW